MYEKIQNLLLTELPSSIHTSPYTLSQHHHHHLIQITTKQASKKKYKTYLSTSTANFVTIEKVQDRQSRAHRTDITLPSECLVIHSK